MIKTLNAIRLAKAKFHTKRRLTILSLITSGLLFGVLIATIVIANGSRHQPGSFHQRGGRQALSGRHQRQHPDQ